MRVGLFYLMLVFTMNLQGQTKLETAQSELKNLKEGMMLVRLKTNQAKIDVLLEQGMNEEAEKVREDQYEENKESILAFKQIFNFCPVYFFYSDKSDEVRQGNIAGNIFDSEMNVIEDLSSLPEYYLTGEFAKTPNLKMEGFVIMDNQMLPLEKPFPYYQREHIFIGLVSLSKGQIIERLNVRLFDTYNHWFPSEQ